jgi:sec-independent protein translocase protein TatA
MGSFSIFHWLLVLVVILILFGAGRLPSVMGDLAKGIKAFRSGLKDEGEKPADPATPAAAAPQQVPPPVQAAAAPPGRYTAIGAPEAAAIKLSRAAGTILGGRSFCG